jgi:hypothetical protein
MFVTFDYPPRTFLHRIFTHWRLDAEAIEPSETVRTFTTSNRRHGMKYLSNRFDEIVKQNTVNVHDWAYEREWKIGNELSYMKPDYSLSGCGMLSSFSLGLLALMAASSSPASWSPFVMWTLCSCAFVFAASALLFALAFLQFSRLQQARKTELWARLKQDPLYARAKLIEKAVGDYRTHCSKYRAWLQAVDRGLAAADEELAERYYAFLSRANGVLAGTIQQFRNATKLHERQRQYVQEHPEIATSPEDTGLSDLMSQLNQPVELPRDLGLIDPHRSLAYEEALAKLSDELEGGESHKWDTQIAAVRARHATALKAG